MSGDFSENERTDSCDFLPPPPNVNTEPSVEGRAAQTLVASAPGLRANCIKAVCMPCPATGCRAVSLHSTQPPHHAQLHAPGHHHTPCPATTSGHMSPATIMHWTQPHPAIIEYCSQPHAPSHPCGQLLATVILQGIQHKFC